MSDLEIQYLRRKVAESQANDDEAVLRLAAALERAERGKKPPEKLKCHECGLFVHCLSKKCRQAKRRRRARQMGNAVLRRDSPINPIVRGIIIQTGIELLSRFTERALSERPLPNLFEPEPPAASSEPQ